MYERSIKHRKTNDDQRSSPRFYAKLTAGCHKIAEEKLTQKIMKSKHKKCTRVVESTPSGTAPPVLPAAHAGNRTGSHATRSSSHALRLSARTSLSLGHGASPTHLPSASAPPPPPQRVPSLSGAAFGRVAAHLPSALPTVLSRQQPALPTWSTPYPPLPCSGLMNSPRPSMGHRHPRPNSRTLGGLSVQG